MPPKKITTQSDYQTLQLKPGASLDSIKKSYKTLVKIWHPDLFPSNQPKAQEKANKMFRLINESYSRLVKYHDHETFHPVSSPHISFHRAISDRPFQ